MDESTVRRTIERVENALIKSGKFSLPGRKALRDNVDFEVIVIDVAESPVERPQKNNDAITAARKSDHARQVHVDGQEAAHVKKSCCN